MITLASATELLEATKPTTGKAIEALCAAGLLHEITGKKRDRVYSYQAYLDVLSVETDMLTE